MLPVTVDPSCMRFGRIDDADLDLERPGGGIGLGRHLPHAAGGPHARIVGQHDLHQRIARPRPNELLGHIEHRIASALARDIDDHLAGADHFARLGADRGHHAGSIGEQDRVAQLILRDAHLRLGGVDLGLGAQQGLLGFVEFGARRPAALPGAAPAARRSGAPGSGPPGPRRDWPAPVRSMFCWFCGSSWATTWPGRDDIAHVDRSRLIMRPSRRKARLT